MSLAPFDSVVVTGVGMVTPFGWGAALSWRALLDGKRAARWAEVEDVTLVGGDRKNTRLPATDVFGAFLAPTPPDLIAEFPTPRDPLLLASLFAAREAWQMAGLAVPNSQPSALAGERIGIVFGTSKGGVWSALQAAAGANEYWLDVFPHRASQVIGADLGACGPNICPVAACATGTVAAIRGVQLLNAGLCDVVVVGSADASLQPGIWHSFRRLGVLASPQPSASEACRPCDKDRTGFVMGEGAGALVLERESYARQRGAKPLAKYLAGLERCDPSGVLQPDPGSRSLSQLISAVLADGNLGPAELDHVQLHATGTQAGDAAECRAITKALGVSAAFPGPVCSALKGGLGHLLGAAGSVELAVAVLTLAAQAIPPMPNFGTASQGDIINYVGQQPRLGRLRTALKLSSGFGGHLTGILLGDVPGGAPILPTRIASEGD